MKVTVMGSGYVGLVSSACLANAGHQVVCFDIDSTRIDRLRQGICPVFEPGLEDCIVQGMRAASLAFSDAPATALAGAEVIIIAVGTPPGEDGSADICHVLAAATLVGRHLEQQALVVTKSTVPVGTTEQVRERIGQVLAKRGAKLDFAVASNPEFLKEGAAVGDFMKPDRIVIGTDSPWAEKVLRSLYAPFNRNHERIMVMDVRSAELTKYAANAMLATKISFINEIANIAEILGADIEKVRQGIGADPRIGYQFIYPGCGYGGSCFPKDVRALEAMALNLGYRPQLLRAVREVNERQKQRLAEKVLAYYDKDIRGRTFAVWGLAFKPRTDDMREAPSRALLEALWQAGARVRAFDPRAMNECQARYGERDDLLLLGTKEAAAKGADALIICTEWKGFWAPDFDLLRTLLRNPVIFDGRNLYDPALLAEQGFDYMAIGRGIDPQPAGVRARRQPVRAA
ncbi:MAG: UDP-glucose/GDP-mannose dehydrogenase family protein [Porticoccaceae bacterium]